MTEHKSYEETIISPNEVIRKFSYITAQEHLKWHRDAEDRFVIIIDDGGWCFQMENELPISLSSTKCLFIPKMKWHRVIRGHGNLIIKICKR